MAAHDRLIRPRLEQLDPRSSPDARAAQKAAAEWSVLSLSELRGCGLSPDQVTHRLRKGWLHRLYPRVYAVGHPAVSLDGRFLAAVKSVGEDAVLSHFSAAALWEFVAWDGRHPEVTVPRGGIKRPVGIRTHRSSVLERRELMRHKGILVTSPARTLVDLAGVVNYRLLRRAWRQALFLRRVGLPQLVAAARRLGPRRGTANLNRVLTAGPVPTQNDFEDVVHDLIVDGGLPPPDVNRPLRIAGRRVIPDLRLPEQRVVVEADGAAWHGNPVAREDDAERQALLEAHGERVIRVTWRQAIARPRQTLARVRAALAQPRGGSLSSNHGRTSGSAAWTMPP